MSNKQAPDFSIVMPSFLGDYKGAARNRDTKIHRAIESVLNQTHKSWELVIVSDGCKKTWQILEDTYQDHPQITAYMIPKAPLFSGLPRNKGIHEAQGTWITYLDIDDYLGDDHLKIIWDQVKDMPDLQWCYFNDMVFNKQVKGFQERLVHITHRFRHGTSNLAHRRDLGAYWKTPGYLHDYHFAQDLRHNFPVNKQISTPQYYVCHLPNRYDI